MKRRNDGILFYLLVLSMVPLAQARPLFTEEVATIGAKSFEAVVSGSKRFDAFSSPEITYKTVNLPGRFTFGLGNKLDLGITFQYLSHTLNTQTSKLSGSQTALNSTHLKARFNDHTGLLLIWHYQAREDGSENLPIGRGNDIEVLALFKSPTAWPLTFNIGEVFRESHKSQFGIQGGPSALVRPGNIFIARTALEIPLKYHVSLVHEWLYHKVGKKYIGGQELTGSDGEALDAVFGLTWAAYNWTIGGGAGFGLLEESHTSFDLERGAGDIILKLQASYRLSPKGRSL